MSLTSTKREKILAQFGAELNPIVMPAPVIPKTSASQTGLRRWIVLSDTHFPLQDDRVLSIIYQVCKDWGPHGVILNGDILDMNAIKEHPPDLSENWGLEEERLAAYTFYHRLHQVLPKNAQILETNGNHSGGGPDSRWRRYLSRNLGALAGLPNLMKNLEYANVFHPQEDWSRVQLVDHAVLGKGLIAVHGEIVRPKAGYSARGMLEKYRANLIHGHTHRMGYTGYRVPGIGGQREHQMRAYEGGCCLRLDPVYTRAPDWQQGFCLVTADPDGPFAVEQVLVHEGVAVSTTMERKYTA